MCFFTPLVCNSNLILLSLSASFFFYLFLVLTFVVLVGTSTSLFHFLKCRPFPLNDGSVRYFLTKDLSIDCDSQEYKNHLYFAFAAILIYPIGIPLMYTILVWKSYRFLSDQDIVDREADKGNPHIGHLIFLTDACKNRN